MKNLLFFLLGVAVVLGVSSYLEQDQFGATTARTTITNPWTFASTLTVNGTTTIARSPDGFVVWDDFTMSTGTAKAVYTNSGGALLCDDDSGAIYFDSTAFSPSLVVSIGTSTSATGYATNLLASTTIATSSDSVIDITYAAPFVLAYNESLVAALSDITNSIASSTHYSNWIVQFGIHCWAMGE